jgi:hypothetical protein
MQHGQQNIRTTVVFILSQSATKPCFGSRLQLIRKKVDVPWRRTQRVSLQHWCPPNQKAILWILSTVRTWNCINRSTVSWPTGRRVGYPPHWDSCLMLWTELNMPSGCCPSVRPSVPNRRVKKLLIYCAFVNYKPRTAFFWLLNVVQPVYVSRKEHFQCCVPPRETGFLSPHGICN